MVAGGALMWLKEWGKTFLQGVLIGVANIIPGVSGGTLALMLGIYQRTIGAICSVNLELLGKVIALLRNGKEAWGSLWLYARDKGLVFLACLGFGAIAGIVHFASVMGWVLEHHSGPAFAFFAGLVLASILFPWRCLTRRSWRELVAGLLAFVLVVGLSLAVTDTDRREKVVRKQAIAQEHQSGTEQVARLDAPRMLFVFCAGMLAVSAMVLPGISGSFLLLLMGVYFDILRAINQREFLFLCVFAAGIGVGLLVFTRFISKLLARFFNVTMAFMIGLMAGSLYELWPFKGHDVVGGETVVLGNTLQGIDPGGATIALVTFTAGVLLVLGFSLFDNRNAGQPGASGNKPVTSGS
jgi:putative membrane protein